MRRGSVSMRDKDEFSRFLQQWLEEHIDSLGERNPSEPYYGRCADQLWEDATAKGFRARLGRMAREYKGGLREYIARAYKRRHSDL
jgi:hypothetical protein